MRKVYANLALKHVQMDSDHNWKAENMNEESKGTNNWKKQMADLHADSWQLAAALTDGVCVGPEEGAVLHTLAVN